MHELVNAIKRAVEEAIEASKPVKVAYGTVVGVAPLTVRLSEKFTLTNTALVLTSAITDDQGNLALAIGDKLLLLRERGGQRYAVIDRVVTI